jgi:hypothetical protein
VNDENALAGGIANAGKVVRAGDHVLRPGSAYAKSIHQFLRALRDEGFDGASQPVGVDPDGRERLEFIEGEVALPPYPDWAQRDDPLASLAELVRRFHEASRRIDLTGLDWNHEMADPVGGVLVCHNDVCLENVVFRDGEAVGLLDFDFAAPGRPEYDLAQFARMCVPVDDEVNAPRLGWHPVDKPARLRLVADAYGLDTSGRTELLCILSESMEGGAVFLRRRVAAGDPNFVRMWTDMGGEERFDRRRRWWEDNRAVFERAMK